MEIITFSTPEPRVRSVRVVHFHVQCSSLRVTSGSFEVTEGHLRSLFHNFGNRSFRNWYKKKKVVCFQSFQFLAHFAV